MLWSAKSSLSTTFSLPYRNFKLNVFSPPYQRKNGYAQNIMHYFRAKETVYIYMNLKRYTNNEKESTDIFSMFYYSSGLPLT